jgi:hypothetical protein
MHFLNGKISAAIVLLFSVSSYSSRNNIHSIISFNETATNYTIVSPNHEDLPNIYSNINIISNTTTNNTYNFTSPETNITNWNRNVFNYTDNSALMMDKLKIFISDGNFSDVFENYSSNIRLDHESSNDSDGKVSQQHNSNVGRVSSPEHNSDSFLYFSSPDRHTSQNCYIIKMKESVRKETFEKLSEIFGAIDAKIQKKYKHGFLGYSICFPENTLPLDLLKTISSIEFVERDNVISSNQIQEDAPWGLARLSSPDPKSSSFGFEGTGEGVNIYVIDSGLARTEGK